MALGCLAVFTKSEFIVLVIGGLFVAEALSVMIQVFYYKKTHKRIFLMAPLHHHFEKKGWSETKVVVRFWIVSGVLAALGFAVYFAETLMAVA
ncbi:MAG: phospho-N-acetylmuramoyl-pentapeptide-transferase, partial [Senegalimassilia anaerobia]